MPSIAAVAFNPYEANVFAAPVMGSFMDMWDYRQQSDIIMDDATQKNRLEDAPQQEEQQQHTVRVLQHNPYSLTHPITQVFSCSCEGCSNNDSCHSQATAPTMDDIFHASLVSEEDLVLDTRFMPPPPPRTDTYDVIKACGAHEPDSVVYHMMMRWFSRVSRVQNAFDVDAPCPAPAPAEYDFVSWCGMVNEWWFRNFEHRQKKQFSAPAERFRGHQRW